MPDLPTVRCDVDGAVTIVTIDRYSARNAVNPTTAAALADVFRRFDADASQHVAILTGAGGTFCAGYDLKQTAAGHRGHRLESGDGPMGPTRLMLGKPVIAMPSRADWSSRCGAISEWRHAMRRSGCTAGASACLSWISAPSACPV
jgi:enoyl-CoA hydratase/carnithine racemase